MTLADLIAAYRTDANDKAAPYFASDEEVAGWLNEAVAEAAIRGRMIHESEAATVCQIAVVAGTASYATHPALYELTHIAFRPAGATGRSHIFLASTEHLDSVAREWRDAEGAPEFAVQTDTDLRLVPRPTEAGTLLLEGYRIPLEPMTLADKDSDTPEIKAAHHRHLVYWALHRGFSIPDTEAFDPNRAALAEREFSRYFGLRPDAELRSETREDVPHTVKAFWP